MTCLRCVLLTLLPHALLFQTVERSRCISFDDYPTTRVFKGNAAQPRFTTSYDAWPDTDPKFRESVHRAVLNGPNFAGTATVVETSCGTGCEYIAVVDNETGIVSTRLPFFALLVGPFRDGKGREHLGGIEFRLTVVC